MQFIPVINTVALQFIHEYLGQRLSNTLYVKQESPITSADLADLASNAAGLWATNIMPHLSGDTRFVLVSAKDLSAQNGLVYDYTGTPLPTTGGAMGQPLPSNVAAVLSLRTGRAGRSYRGRLYLGGFTELQSDGNFLPTGILENLRQGLINVITALNTGTRQVVVVSKFTANQPRTTGVTTPVTTVLARTIRLASQRKRLPE